MQPSDPTDNLENSQNNINLAQPNTALSNTQKEDKLLNPLLVFLAVLSGILVIIILGLLLVRNNFLFKNITNNSRISLTPTPIPATRTSVSGVVQFEGYAPAGSYIAISEKSENTSQFKDVVSGILPESGNIPWDWSDAKTGKNYYIKATLKVSGKIVDQSSVSFVSAPADTIILPLISNQNPPASTTAPISGNIHLDGYIPSGSYINLVAKSVNSSNFSTIISNLNPVDNTAWNWNNANLSQTYEIQANLMNAAGILISQSDLKTLTAPSSNILFTLSSTAKPPAAVITGITGMININGSIPTNSYITLGIRPTGTGTFNQINGNISATDGVSWNWNSANSGTSYDVQAYLWANGKPYSQSNILTVTAPSSNNLLTINAQQPVSAPNSSTINVACNGQQNGQWQVTINYNTQSNLVNPQNYNLVLTYAAGGNQVLNTTVTPGNPSQSQSLTTSYILTNGATYYAQYAYSNTSNPSNYSPLSPSIQFSCQ